ncbi:hypothetical protein CFB44_18555 [Burkholderia sp. AU31280]|nr:hypothetical protein CFB44_18555 [Burkholderia sp. AU31280]
MVVVLESSIKLFIAIEQIFVIDMRYFYSSVINYVFQVNHLGDNAVVKNFGVFKNFFKFNAISI